MNWIFDIVLRPVKRWYESLPWWQQVVIAAVLGVVLFWWNRDQVIRAITPSPTAPKIINFKNFTVNRTLSGEEYAGEGIEQMKAVVEDPSYCQGAQVVLLQAGQYDPPGSFLSTALPGKLTHCNTLPIRFDMSEPVRSVTVDFRGAAVPYELKAYDKAGRLVG